jgi:putative ABC transport system permease protein
MKQDKSQWEQMAAMGRAAGGGPGRQEMSALKQARARLISLFRREAEAPRLARITFGAVEASKDAYRESRGLAWLDGIFYDLRFALRSLRRDRAFTITAITMLALAIGLNVTVFTVMNTMLFRGFPLVKGNDRLVYIQERYPSGFCCLSYPDFEDWRAQAQSFQGMAFVGGTSISLSDGGGRAVDTFTATLSSNAFGLLGVKPLLGRDFAPADEAPGAPPVVILSYRFWEARFGKRADIVGHMIRINKAPAAVIGVMPEGFDFPEQQNLWMPLEHTAELQQRGPGNFMAFGRLAEGATLASARAELETINRRLASVYPATNRDVVPRVGAYSQFFVGPNAAVVYGSLWAAAWFVLLIACANLANLTLARTLGRSREFSTRIALGAGHWRMVRQILSESLLLAGAGGALGWWIAKWSVRTWATATESRYQVLDYTVDYGTLAYLIAISITAALLFGLVPIGRVLQLDVNGALKGDARGATQGLRGKYLSAALVAGQMALAIILLSGAGILVRSLLNVVNAEVGVSAPERVLIGWVAVSRDKYPSPESRVAFFDNLKLRLLAIPGVESASIASVVPVDNAGITSFELETQPVGAADRPVVSAVASGPGYFRTVGATTVAGRDFSNADLPNARPVAIVNQSFVAKYWPGQDPLGKRLRLFPENKPGEWRTIVGVASNIMQDNPTRQKFLPLVYVPFRQQPSAAAWFLARTRVPPVQVAAAVRAEVQKLDSDLTLERLSTVKQSFTFRRDRMDLEHAEMGKHAAVAPIFAVMAFILAVVGLYAVIAHSVSQRTKEIGVRIAIGAAPGDIRRLIFREGMLPVALGLILGLTLSLAVNRILESQLVGVSPYDPVTLAAASVTLIMVALLACQIPSRRAICVDPAVALRHE